MSRRSSVASSSPRTSTDERPLPRQLVPQQCAGPWCRKAIVQPRTGRTRRFCSDECRKAAHQQKRTAELHAERQRQHDEWVQQQRREREQFAGQLVVAMRKGDPAKMALRVAELLERDESLYWQLGRLLRFIDR